jgi:hypothetical protein
VTFCPECIEQTLTHGPRRKLGDLLNPEYLNVGGGQSMRYFIWQLGVIINRNVTAEVF